MLVVFGSNSVKIILTFKDKNYTLEMLYYKCSSNYNVKTWKICQKDFFKFP